MIVFSIHLDNTLNNVIAPFPHVVFDKSDPFFLNKIFYKIKKANSLFALKIR